MNLETGNVHKRSQALSDAVIRRCLLGCADASEQAKFEMLLMFDDQFEKRVYRLELELTDDFSFGTLSEAERQLFKARFLVTRGRLRELTVSQALVHQASQWKSQEEQRTDWRLALLNFFAADHWVKGHALAATTLMFFSFLFWLSPKAPSPQEPLIRRKQQQLATPERHFAHPVSNESSQVKPGAESASEQTERPPVVLSRLLQPDSDSSNRTSLHIANAAGEAAAVRFELFVNNANGNSYQASLMTEAGQQVTAFNDLQTTPEDSTKVVVSIPAQLLKDGIYYINVTRTSDSDSRSLRYTFQVKHD